MKYQVKSEEGSQLTCEVSNQTRFSKPKSKKYNCTIIRLGDAEFMVFPRAGMEENYLEKHFGERVDVSLSGAE